MKLSKKNTSKANERQNYRLIFNEKKLIEYISSFYFGERNESQRTSSKVEFWISESLLRFAKLC